MYSDGVTFKSWKCSWCATSSVASGGGCCCWSGDCIGPCTICCCTGTCKPLQKKPNWFTALLCSLMKKQQNLVQQKWKRLQTKHGHNMTAVGMITTYIWALLNIAITPVQPWSNCSSLISYFVNIHMAKTRIITSHFILHFKINIYNSQIPVCLMSVPPPLPSNS